MKILVFQHIASEHPGSFRDVMRDEGHSMHAVELDEGETIPPLDDYDALLVMGGPMDVWQEDEHPWLRAEKAAIRDWVNAGRPYLGMCLGNQLLADALGGKVALMTAAPEVGISQIRLLGADPIFAGVPEQVTCFQWHAAEVTALPEGGRQLATSPGCRIQAIAIGEHAYGLQCHMELTDTTAAEWGAIPEYAVALEKVRGPGSLPEVQREVAENFAPLQDAAQRIFSNFLAIAAKTLARETA